MSAFLALLQRDVRLALRQGSDAALVVVFFVLAAVLYPFAIGTDPALLGRIAGGVVWVTALLAALLSLERVFLADHQDGALDLLALAPEPLPLLVLAKVAAHWLTTALPLIAAAPVVAAMLGAPAAALAPQIAALARGTPRGVLIPLLVLPLYVPVLIFGAAAVEAALTGASLYAPLAILGALLLAALPLAPLAAAAGLRNALR
jgi:heme exporter protein B